jgi:tRNA A22 N-methylase
MTNKLNEVFNLQPSESQKILREVGSDDDYELARDTLREVITQGRNALDDVISLARSSEHPRSYEVAGQIMKTMSDVAKDLLTLKKQKFELDNPKESPAAAAQIAQQNNIVFAGSTEDLLRMIKQQDTKTIDS